MILTELPNDIIDKVGNYVMGGVCHLDDYKNLPLVCKGFNDVWKRIDGHQEAFWEITSSNEFFKHLDRFIRKK